MRDWPVESDESCAGPVDAGLGRVRTAKSAALPLERRSPPKLGVCATLPPPMQTAFRIVVMSLILISAAALHATSLRSARHSQVVAAAGDLIRDPSIAARRLYDAWQAKNRQGADVVATGDAVTKLFGLTPVPLMFTHCQRTGVGEFECVYRNPNDDLEVWFKVLGGASAGYHVESVSFSTD
jgi:hypothetical protein